MVVLEFLHGKMKFSRPFHHNVTWPQIVGILPGQPPARRLTACNVCRVHIGEYFYVPDTALVNCQYSAPYNGWPLEENIGGGKMPS